jgi:VWFA-related protein
VHDVSGWQSPVGGVDVDSIVEGTSSSPVYDALFLALMHKPDLDRRHLVVAMTDGMDNGSWMDSATVRDIARRADSVLHVVIIPEGNPTARNGSPSRYAWRSLVDGSSDANLEAAATLTGGEFHRAPFFDTRNRVINAFKEAFDDFRLSYLLRYTPQGVAPTGWHDLRVQVTHHPDYTVRARKGYFGD